MAQAWDRTVDVLVAGTGAAALTAAIAAADAGAQVLVVESTDKWGGTTALSGGGLWMPANPLMRTFGRADTAEQALTYMAAAIGDAGPASSPERRRAFVDTIGDVYHLLARLGVRWTPAKDYPDYYPDRPGGTTGRAIEVEPFDTRRLGEWFATFRGRESLPAPLKTDDVWLLSRAWSTPDGFRRGAQFVFAEEHLFALGEARCRRAPEDAGVRRDLVVTQEPGAELVLDVGERRDLADVHERLLAHAPPEALHLAARRRVIGPRVQERDAEP